MNDYTQTPNLGLYKPEVNADYDLWGDHLNANADILDGVLQAKAILSDTAPTSPRKGDLWFDTVNAQLYVWYVDPTSSQWVIATAQISAALVSDTPPSSPANGQFWFDSVSAQLYVWYVDPTSAQWVPANTPPAGPGLPKSITATSYTVLVTDSTLLMAPTGTHTLTLLAAATYPGRYLRLKLTTASAVNSASSNVVPLAGGAAAAAILAATAGKFALLQSDGANWQIMEAN